MAFPLTSTLIDNFNRSDGGIGAAYTALSGGFNVASNQIAPTTTGVNNVYRNDLTPVADCELVVTVTTLPASGQGVSLYLRFNTTSYNGYSTTLYYTGTNFTCYIYRVTGGTPTAIATVTGLSFSAGDKLGFQIVGTQLRVFRYNSGAWTQMAAVTDATYSGTGRFCLQVASNVARLDDFYGGGATFELLPSSISSGEGFGTATVSGAAGSQTLSPSGIASTETFGTPSISVGGVQTLSPTGITSGEAFGTAVLSRGSVAVSPTSIGSGEAFGMANVHGPITSIKFGIVGDSDWDSFRADDNRGGTYAAVTFSPGELMVRALSWNLGTWGTYGEPRRTDYARNWARSRATVGTLFINSGTDAIVPTGQHTGLAAQITAGDVDTAVVWAGGNDLHLWNNTYADVYNGVVAGADLTSKINSYLSNMTTILDTLISAGCQRIVVRNEYDIGPDVAGTFTNATYRLRVTNAVATINAGLVSLVAARSQCILYDWATWKSWLLADYDYVPGTGFTILGEDILESPLDDEPHHMVLASTHFGTVFNGILANSVIQTLNDGFGLSLTKMTDLEILDQAGIASHSIAPSGITSGEIFGTATIGRGAVTVTPSSIASGETFGTASITRGAVTITPPAINSGEAFGTVTVIRGAVNLSPSGIQSTEAFGAVTVIPGTVNLSPSGIPSAEAFGTPTVVPGNVNLAPVGIASNEAFGTPTATCGNVNIAPAGIPSGEVFGTANVQAGGIPAQAISPSGIVSAEAFGTAAANPGTVTVIPAGIPSGETFGTANIQPGQVIISPSGISSAEYFGQPSILVGVSIIAPDGIVSREQFGLPQVIIGAALIAVIGIPSGETFGIPSVTGGEIVIQPVSIGSSEAFGIPMLILVSVTWYAVGDLFSPRLAVDQFSHDVYADLFPVSVVGSIDP